MDSVIVAYSGGVDSACLAKAAYDVLKDAALAVTADSESYAEGELEEAIELAKDIGIRHKVIATEEIKNPDYFTNPQNRCYFCKMELFTKLEEVAAQEDMHWIIYGANYDDVGDYRPGMQAADEMEVRAPLKDAAMTKEDVRQLSKKWGLSVWDRPATACLSSRFPYGTLITREGLKSVDKAEQFLRSLGFVQVRVRHHAQEKIARIEVPQEEMERFFHGDVREKVHERFKELGYTYVTLDLKGYRSGSLNETLRQVDRSQ